MGINILQFNLEYLDYLVKYVFRLLW